VYLSAYFSQEARVPKLEQQWVITFGGPDRCGKTTIAKELSRQTGIPYFKPTNQKWFAMNDPKVFEQQTRWAEPKLLDFLKQTGHSVIMDRGYPCDWVYSGVLRRETAWDTIVALDNGYAELRAANIFTLRKDYTGWKDDSWTEIDEQRLADLHKRYEQWAFLSSTPTLVMYVDDEDLPKQINSIINFLQEVRQ